MWLHDQGVATVNHNKAKTTWTSMINFKDFQLTLKEQSGKIKYLGVLAHLPAWIDSFTLKGKCHEKIMLFKDVAPCLKNELQTDPPFSDPVFESWSCSTYLSQDTVPLNANLFYKLITFFFLSSDICRGSGWRRISNRCRRHLKQNVFKVLIVYLWCTFE